ncbi:hypothetical protein GWI33_003113 [Rhynchophorus ferrugineus]|uniref:Uncharacterized protein n=1 Tax=Rhynchophorus ferrugineus TaxID=354439 RepID=A0A834IY30_RHYFE|nr:hypothetical protein GWI33_003113 [Rhynchophorus ferrugineus]
MAAYYWVDSHSSYGVPSTALRGGHDIDGAEIFVGRAFHEGDWLPAKVIPDKRIAYVAYGGSEHMKHDYQFAAYLQTIWNAVLPDMFIGIGGLFDL